ncbi:hypothetical protein CDAR_66071 [Caerostris darwini]|uniref:Uncharacterized protein n=1 Tax=Caerostris darwini TaxID=1538125 RepID=A0AAV4TYU5_9ARAC|nr:hypothetical protein CDAR_66071 [Caerostris darwini]
MKKNIIQVPILLCLSLFTKSFCIHNWYKGKSKLSPYTDNNSTRILNQGSHGAYVNPKSELNIYIEDLPSMHVKRCPYKYGADAWITAFGIARYSVCVIFLQNAINQTCMRKIPEANVPTEENSFHPNLIPHFSTGPSYFIYFFSYLPSGAFDGGD